MGNIRRSFAPMRQLLTVLFVLSVGAASPSLAKQAELSLEKINKAEPAGKKRNQNKAALIKAEVLLDRARFSPGVVDGSNGENVKKAVAAFQRQNGLEPSGTLDQET